MGKGSSNRLTRGSLIVRENDVGADIFAPTQKQFANNLQKNFNNLKSTVVNYENYSFSPYLKQNEKSDIFSKVKIENNNEVFSDIYPQDLWRTVTPNKILQKQIDEIINQSVAEKTQLNETKNFIKDLKKANSNSYFINKIRLQKIEKNLNELSKSSKTANTYGVLAESFDDRTKYLYGGKQTAVNNLTNDLQKLNRNLDFAFRNNYISQLQYSTQKKKLEGITNKYDLTKKTLDQIAALTQRAVDKYDNTLKGKKEFENYFAYSFGYKIDEE